MAEPAPDTTSGSTHDPDADLRDLTVLTRDLHVTYRVYEDRKTNLRELVANRFRRPAYREVRAVQGVDLAAHRGESVGLIGRNGSGKSTLLQAVAGLLPPTKGEVFASSQPSLLGVSAAMQRNASGRRNILLGGLALGLSREEVEAQMGDIIEFTGLADFIDLPIRTYSSGMRARLHFAIATSIEPEILLIDEALSVGDVDFQERSQERVAALLERAGTVFVVSHSLNTVLEMCDRAIWLDQGEIQADGDAEEVVEAYKEYFRKKKRARKAARRKAARQARTEAEGGNGDGDGASGGSQG